MHEAEELIESIEEYVNFLSDRNEANFELLFAKWKTLKQLAIVFQCYSGRFYKWEHLQRNAT